MATFGTAASNLRKLAAALPVRVNEYKKNIAGVVHNHLIQTTDVDTGEAMSNWIISPNSPATETRDAFVPSPSGYSLTSQSFGYEYKHRIDPEITRQNNLAPARQAAEAELASIQPGDSIHITNNVRHVVYLDQGTPGLPGRHFVDQAIVIARDVASRAPLPNEP